VLSQREGESPRDEGELGEGAETTPEGLDRRHGSLVGLGLQRRRGLGFEASSSDGSSKASIR
jgi:hypothetical protein